MSRPVSALLALAAGSVCLFIGCRPAPPPPPVVIGLIVYANGEAGSDAALAAVKMAAELNSTEGGLVLGGVRRQVKVAVATIPGSNPAKSVEAVLGLINREGAVAIVGPLYTMDALPAGLVAENAGVPLISPGSTNPRTTAGRRYVFRACFLDTVSADALADLARDRLGFLRAAILLDITDPYSRDMASVFQKAFEDRGGRVVALETYTPDTKEYGPALGRIRKANPDFLLLANLSKDVREQVIEARKAGIRVPLLGGDTWSRAALAGLPEAEGSYAVIHWTGEVQNERSRRFVDEFTRRNGTAPGQVAALTYDAFLMVLEALALGGKATGRAVMEGLYALPPFEGVTGVIDYVDCGDPVKAPIVVRFQDGRTEPVEAPRLP